MADNAFNPDKCAVEPVTLVPAGHMLADDRVSDAPPDIPDCPAVPLATLPPAPNIALAPSDGLREVPATLVAPPREPVLRYEFVRKPGCGYDLVINYEVPSNTVGGGATTYRDECINGNLFRFQSSISIVGGQFQQSAWQFDTLIGCCTCGGSAEDLGSGEAACCTDGNVTHAAAFSFLTPALSGSACCNNTPPSTEVILCADTGKADSCYYTTGVSVFSTPNVSATIAPVGGYIQLAINDCRGAVYYRVAAGTWQCNACNTLTRVGTFGACAGWPATLEICPTACSGGGGGGGGVETIICDGCAVPLPKRLFATIIAPNCPAVDGMVIPIVNGGPPFLFWFGQRSTGITEPLGDCAAGSFQVQYKVTVRLECPNGGGIFCGLDAVAALLANRLSLDIAAYSIDNVRRCACAGGVRQCDFTFKCGRPVMLVVDVVDNFDPVELCHCGHPGPAPGDNAPGGYLPECLALRKCAGPYRVIITE